MTQNCKMKYKTYEIYKIYKDSWLNGSNIGDRVPMLHRPCVNLETCIGQVLAQRGIHIRYLSTLSPASLVFDCRRFFKRTKPFVEYGKWGTGKFGQPFDTFLTKAIEKTNNDPTLTEDYRIAALTSVFDFYGIDLEFVPGTAPWIDRELKTLDEYTIMMWTLGGTKPLRASVEASRFRDTPTGKHL